MKKVILSLAIIGAAISTQAQDKESKPVNFGVKAGVNISNISFSGEDSDESTDSKIGLHAGVFAELNLAESFAIQPELLYSVVGSKATFSEGGFDVKNKTNLSYISIPVLFKYKVSGFGVYLGPQISILASAKDKFEAEDESESEDIKDALKSSDFSALAGAEYTLPAGLGFSARYVLGLSNISKEDDGDFKMKNNAFQIGVHYRF